MPPPTMQNSSDNACGCDDAIVSTRQAMRYAEDLVRLYQLEQERTEDLQAGARMQKRFLTPAEDVENLLNRCGYNVALYNKAPYSVSGDFFCPKDIASNTCGFFLADSSGHGLSAALISMRILSYIQTTHSLPHTPEHFLESINTDISGLMMSGKFVAANYTILSPHSISVANAGQPFPLFIHDNEINELNISGMPLGLPHSGTAYKSLTAPVVSGDRIILYTDGLTELSNNSGDIYSQSGFMQSIQKNASRPLQEMLQYIMEDLAAFSEDCEPDDDISIVIFERM